VALAVVAAIWMLAQPSGPAGKVARIGLLSPSWSDNRGTVYPQLVRELQALGYVEGKNAFLIARFSEGRDERLAPLAAELVQEKVDVIVAMQPSGALAAKRATSSIPIVFVSISDPVRIGVVDNLRRPGGNVTGVANTPADLNAKRLEILKDAIPALRRVAIVARAGNPNSQAHLKGDLKAAEALGLEARVYNVAGGNEFESSFDAIERDDMQAVLLVQDGVFFFQRKRIAGLALKHHLPMIADGWAYAEDGAFLSYGIANYGALSVATAAAVDMILHGIAPGDIPVDQPVDLGLAVNLGVARRLRVPIDRALLLRADKVID
jgi:putative ABC transport system substrate-binding protein